MPLLRSSRHRQKPGPTARGRAARRRREGPVAKKVRAACVERDGHCRYWLERFVNPFMEDIADCDGPSQWAHFGEKVRAKTRNMKPEQRHTTWGSLMLCRLHHDQLDGRQHPRLKIEALTKFGADGPLAFTGGSSPR
jgi:hypothetical protein